MSKHTLPEMELSRASVARVLEAVMALQDAAWDLQLSLAHLARGLVAVRIGPLMTDMRELALGYERCEHAAQALKAAYARLGTVAGESRLRAPDARPPAT